MKTITLKADEGFDTTLTGLAESLHTTKSGVIRAAVLSYKKQLERESLARQVRAASLAVREQTVEISKDMAGSAADRL